MSTAFWQDVRVAARALVKSPLLFVPAAATLAVAIGTNAAVFSVVNTLLLRPPPVDQPERLYWVTSEYATNRGFRAGVGWNNTMWETFRDRSDGFAGALAWQPQRFVVGSGADAESVNGMFVSGGFFSTLGVRAIHGRVFTTDDDRAAEAAVVISARFWRRRFGARADIVGTPVVVNGVTSTIIGVTAPAFAGLDTGKPFDVALPMSSEPAIQGRMSRLLKPRGNFLLFVLVRLKDGQPVATATDMLRALQPAIVPAGAPQFLTEPFTLEPMAGGMGPASPERVYRQPLWTLLAGVGLVLVVASVNVANLVLARGIARRREISLRLAVGATRWAVVRAVTVESLMLAVIGGVLGLLIAVWGSRAIVSLVAIDLQPVLDWRVLAFTSGVTVLSLLLFSVIPALRATRVAPAELMKDAGTRVTDRSRQLSLGLVVLQIALALVLVVAGGLLLKTFRTMANTPLGFDADRVMVVEAETARSADSDVTAGLNTSGSIVDRLASAAAAVPGVESAAASMWTPLSGEGGLISMSTGRSTSDESGDVNVLTNFVAPGWFAVYGTTLKAGREFTPADADHAGQVVIVNEAYVRRFIPDGVAIGTAISDRRVVGVVADAVYRSSERVPGMSSLAFRERVPPTIYAPLAQVSKWDRPATSRLFISARSRDDRPEALVPALRRTLSAVDPAVTFEFRALADYARASLSQERMTASVALFFAVVSALLATFGLYAVTSYTASRRSAEVGVRMSLGASRLDIVRLMLRQALVAVAIGIAAGLGASLLLMRTLASLVFGISPLDPATFAAATATLTAVAMLAAFVPAYRASRLNPIAALRAE